MSPESMVPSRSSRSSSRRVRAVLAVAVLAAFATANVPQRASAQDAEPVYGSGASNEWIAADLLIARPIALFHMPVPRDRSDDAYFVPLADLALRPETRLSLGLVHHTDGVAGTRKRLATAEKHASDFLIATECGFGRRAPETIPELLRIHAEVAKAP